MSSAASSEYQEVLAAVRIVLSVAKADGVISPEEERSLQDVLFALPEEARPSLDTLLGTEIDLDAELERLQSEGMRDRVYQVARLIAEADGQATEEELVILERIKPLEGEDSLLGQVIGETQDTLLPSRIPAIHDPEQRAVEIQEDRMKFAVLAAALGANPLPAVSLITDIAVVGLQVKLVRDIGQYYGHRIDDQAARSLLASFVGSTVLRVALSNLAKFLPGWGSVAGAATSFAATWAIGKVAEAWFESNCTLDPDALRDTYQAAWKEGQRSYDVDQERINEQKAQHEAILRRHEEDLSAGRITEEDYHAQVAKLGHWRG